MVVLVGPQCIGKSTATRALIAQGMVSCSADTHMKASGGYDYRRITECHQACKRDAVEALLSGTSAVIDNTNMHGTFRSEYLRMAQMCGVKCVVHVFSPELWLTCTTKVRNDTLDELCLRAERRAASAATEFEITRDIIERTVGTAVNDIGGRSLDEWCGYVAPLTSYEYGVTLYHGALVYRDKAIEVAAEETMKTDRFTTHKDILRARLYREIARGFGEYHITIMAPQEVLEQQTQTPEELVKAVGKDAAATAGTVVNRGIGRVVNAENAFALFSVYEWEWVQEYRKALDLPPKDCHVTLAFSGSNDIHEFPKDLASCSW